MSLEKITKLKAKMKAVQVEIAALAKSSGDEIIQELFAPLWETGVLGASWTQYTPYFNDGDSCEFSVCADEMPVQWPGLPDLDGYESSAGHIRYYLSTDETRYSAQDTKQRYLDLGMTLEKVVAVEKITDAISAVLNDNEELLFAAYGDHVEITVTPNGVTVDEYEHD